MKNLGAVSDYSDSIGEVDMFGLDEFGQPTGMGGGWGALIGGGLSTATSIGVRAFAKSASLNKWSEGIGALAGSVAGGTMMAFKKTRHAGLVALGTVLATNGLRQLETLLAPAAPAAQVAAQVAAQAGVKGPVIDSTGVVRGSLGVATIDPSGVVRGGDMGAPPQLLGRNAPEQRRMAAQLLGIPNLESPFAAMSGSFGATIFGN